MTAVPLSDTVGPIVEVLPEKERLRRLTSPLLSSCDGRSNKYTGDHHDGGNKNGNDDNNGGSIGRSNSIDLAIS